MKLTKMYQQSQKVIKNVFNKLLTFTYYINCTVLKIGPYQLVRPVQAGIESQFGPVKSPKIGQQSENRPKTGVEPKIKKKVLCSVRFLKP